MHLYDSHNFTLPRDARSRGGQTARRAPPTATPSDPRTTGRCAITLAEYLNPERFPLTTVRGLPEHLQRRLDTANLAWLEEQVAGGRELSDLQQRRLKELQDKAAAHPALRAEAARLRAEPETKRTTGEQAGIRREPATAPAPSPASRS